MNNTFYVLKNEIDFIDVWLDGYFDFYVEPNINNSNNFFKYFSGIYHNTHNEESRWFFVKNENRHNLFDKNLFFDTNNQKYGWMDFHKYFKFIIPIKDEEELFYFKLKYC